MTRTIRSRALVWLVGAALFTLCEIALGLGLGAYALRGRAEATLFLGFRPWLLLLLVLALAHRSIVTRWTGYAAALGLASLSEAVLAWRLGAPFPSPEMARAIAAGAAIVVPLDILVVVARRAFPRERLFLPGLVGLAVLALPGPVRMFESIALPTPVDTTPQVRVALLTGLPLIWGEAGVAGALDEAGGPAEVYGMLGRHFRLRTIDALPPDGLARREILVAAQPRPLSPYELVTLDNLVRGGGRVLLLTDPQLRWPSTLPIGDPRRPPPAGTIDPLLAHWGLEATPPANGAHAAPADYSLYVGDRPFRVRVLAPGVLEAGDRRCRVMDRGLVADCRIGRGRAVIVADADLLHDALWVGPGLYGAGREGRLADNAHYVASRIADLAGMPAFAPTEAVRWADPIKSHGEAIVAALIPSGVALVLALFLLRRPGRRGGAGGRR